MSEIRKLQPQQRAASIVPASFNEAERTVEVTWTTGARVRRFDFWSGQSYDEELVVDARSVDMGRLNSGRMPVLDSHRSYGIANQIGVVERGWLDGNEGRALLRLSDREELAGIVRDVGAGIISNISTGYTVRKYEIVSAVNRTDGGTVPLYRAVDWEPAELSFVPIPADAGAGTRNHPQGQPCEFIRAEAQPPMESIRMSDDVQKPADSVQKPAVEPNPAELASRAVQEATQRAADITDLCVRHGVQHLAAAMLRDGKTLDQARSAVLEELARRDAAAGGHQNTRIETVRDEQHTRGEGMVQAIMHRVSPGIKLDDNGRQFRGMSLLELGREMLESQGVRTRGMPALELARQILHYRAAGMNTTSDFSSLMANVANKRLRQAYDENVGTYGLWARRAPNAPDFKNIQVTVLSGAPDLLQVNEHGEFKYGSMKDGAETYAVISYGRIVAMTRQAIINDDLRGFDRLVTAFGFASRRLENRTVYSQLTANAALSDTVALFHATHANLGTGAGSALQFSALTTARAAMRVQKGQQSEELNIAPAYLIVPAALEQTAYQLTSSNYVPATKAEVNEFREGGRTSLTPVVEPVLDANSATAWYLAASNSQIDTVEYCYLDGAEGAVIESEPGFEVDGVSYKCRLDFAAKAVDYRGLYKANGA